MTRRFLAWVGGRPDGRSLPLVVPLAFAIVALASPLPTALLAQAPTATCTPADTRPSLVRIAQPGKIQGTGVVIVRRDAYVVVLTVKHVMPDNEDFEVTFQAAPQRSIPVKWTDEMILAVPPDTDLFVFRVDAPIPREVVPEDPYGSTVPESATLRSWGYPSASGATLCTYEGRLAALNSGEIVADGYIPPGVSGGPMFFLDPDDGAPKLAGIVARGDGQPGRGTTRAIDIRQAVTIVAT